jgi:methylase of polypeptide subunit release factors
MTMIRCHACLVRFLLAQGSGVQAVALGRRCPTAELTLVDKSPRALRFAKFNLLLNGISSARARLVHSDLYSSLPPLPAAAEAEEGLGFFDLITANPPFVPNPRLDYPDLSEEEKEEQQEKRSDVGGSSTSTCSGEYWCKTAEISAIRVS